MGSTRRPAEGRVEAARAVAPAATARWTGGGDPGLPALRRTIGNRAAGDLLAARSHDAGCGDGCRHGGSGSADSLVDAALRGGGRPLETPFQREMEPTFPPDLSAVREFRGPAAERAASAVDAKAFTIGNAIVYGAGGQSRETRIHELTHVANRSPPRARRSAGWTSRTRAVPVSARRRRTPGGSPPAAPAWSPVGRTEICGTGHRL
ncbi:hypothetical protein Ate01nite_46220 [Actinoplanes teichomyceticus]|nr:hypothetical protein Ate01nite_46220 [Actinoplanes teichomyceticus]